MKDLIETLDEVVMKQVFDKDEYIIAVNRAKSILEKIDKGKIAKELLLQECGMRWESINDEEKEYWIDKAKSLFDYFGGGE